ncbi:MAG: DUF4125 family protein [Desulfovibrionaceae bacterium]
MKTVQEQIVNIEWEMFSQVHNADGPMGCQTDRTTFKVMRSSQAESWPQNVLESWLHDLETAKCEGRNLMSEKYAWMMESTFPEEFSRLAGSLPAVDSTTLSLIEDIVHAHVAWKLEIAQKYPRLNEKGRPVRSCEDGPWITSFETYLRGELKTYSPETVRRLHHHVQNLQARGENAAETTLQNQVRHYGYASLDAVE